MNDKPPSRKRARGTLEFYSEIPQARVRKDFALACAGAAMRRIPASVNTIRLVLIGDRKMAKLHRDFLNIRGTTDVLTFTLSEPEEALEGEIYICLDQARRQAKHYRVPLYHEVARLAAHGVLHLAGFDDHSERERTEMRKHEDAALRAGRAA
ncbi:MAG: rRNA maturation RNase YbeY [Calditrichaeota bacterium]|nr:rRNA maturation RNase YbeY [Calditrichota bacterium]MCB9391584.1 rRNA maturation RNase YbeY [Calditrichota bacterium]